MLETKTTLVADMLHGVIALSPVEKRLIATRAFNRLHNVLQNSTVYFTYPSNRTSRFSHSLGVAKIAGELFRNGILNAREDDRHAFLKLARDNIITFYKEGAFSEDAARWTSGNTHLGDLTAAVDLAIPCDFYSSMLLASLTREEVRTYIILLQSVRNVALLHDLGHPPFSHVTEAALINGFYKLQDPSVSPGSQRETLKQELTSFLTRDSDAALENDDAAFHELLGLELTKTLLNSILDDMRITACPDNQLFDAVVIKHATLRILQDKPFFRILHRIVDSDLDADRLDYVQRDLISSGMSREPFRPDRLIQSFTLIADSASKNYPYRFLPSIRALNNLEDFFFQRFQLYKYVIFHHRVVKFDGLLQRCIEDISEQSLNEPLTSSNQSGTAAPSDDNPLLLPPNISGIWSLFSKAVSTNPVQRESFYVQWDDAWLLGALRRKYFSMKRSRSPQDQKTVLEIRLEEILSNQKHYRALFKRGECFFAVDEAFWKESSDSTPFEKMGQWWGLNGEKNSLLEEGARKIGDHVARLRAAAGNEEKLTELVEQNGYVVSKVCDLIRGLCGKRSPLSFLVNAASQFAANHSADDILDVIVIPKVIKAGVKRHFELLDNSGRLMPLGRVSSVADELERASLLFPPFFVYLLTKHEPTNDARMAWRGEFGRLLWNSFEQWAFRK